MLFTWAVPVKTYHYILTNISRIFKAFLAMEKLGEKLGEKFIFLPNPNSKQFDRKKNDKIFRCVNLWTDKQNGKF